ncbi:MAG TPA: hypothetical protein VGM19_00640 [Armatimonadota bacterium]|jgi:hypothetical protein
MNKRTTSTRPLPLDSTAAPQLGLPLPEPPPSAGRGTAWRFCRQCHRPIHPDAPACGWCRRPPRKPKPDGPTLESLFDQDAPD